MNKIDLLINFYKKELSGKVLLIINKKKEKYFTVLGILYLLLPATALLLLMSEINNWTKILTLLIFLAYLIDILFMKKDKGLGNYIFQKNRKRMEPEELFNRRKEKLNNYLRDKKIITDYDQILGIVRERERKKKKEFALITSGIISFVILISKSLYEKLIELLLSHKIESLYEVLFVIVIAITVTVSYIFIRFYTVEFFNIRYNNLIKLKDLLEDITLDSEGA